MERGSEVWYDEGSGSLVALFFVKRHTDHDIPKQIEEETGL